MIYDEENCKIRAEYEIKRMDDEVNKIKVIYGYDNDYIYHILKTFGISIYEFDSFIK